MKRLILLMAVSLALITGVASSAFRAGPATAQEGPEIDRLIQTTLADAELPPERVVVRLLYINMEPGSSNPRHTHPGPELWRVEDGTVTVELQGPGEIVRSGDREGAPTDREFTLTRGEQLTILPSTPMAFSNESDEPVRILAVVILPYGSQAPPGIDYMGVQPPADAYKGLEFPILGDGMLESVPSGNTIVTLERLRLQPGDPIPAEPDPNLLSVARGSLEFTVDGGAVQGPTRTASPGPVETLVEPGTAVSLAQYDAVFFPTGMNDAPRGADQAEITLYRVIISGATPEATPTATEDVAQLSITGPIAESTPTPEATAEATTDATAEPTEEATEESTPTAQASGFTVGQTVYVNETDVRLRDAPTVNSNILTGLTQGQELVITGESVQADDLTWWPVSSPDGASFIGWVAEQFLSATPVT